LNQKDSEHNEVDGMKKGADSTGEVMQTCSVTNAVIKFVPWTVLCYKKRSDL